MPLTKNSESDQGELVIAEYEPRFSPVKVYGEDRFPVSFDVAEIEWTDSNHGSGYLGYVNKRLIFTIHWDSMLSHGSQEERRWLLGNRLPNIKQMRFKEIEEAKIAAKQVLEYFVGKLLKQ